MASGLSGEVPLESLKPSQCLLITDSILGSVNRNTWLDNLYIRYHRTDRSTGGDVVMECASESCNVWLTNMTFQGDGKHDPRFGAFLVTGGEVYAKGECHRFIFFQFSI